MAECVIRRHELLEVVDDEGNKTLRMEVTLRDVEEAKWFRQSLYEIAGELGVLCEPPEDER